MTHVFVKNSGYYDVYHCNTVVFIPVGDILEIANIPGNRESKDYYVCKYGRLYVKIECNNCEAGTLKVSGL